MTDGPKVFGLALPPEKVPVFREHVLSGLVDQDKAFLEACERTGTDPRASMRIALAPGGLFVVSAASAPIVQGLVGSLRASPKRIEFEFEQRPVVDGDATPALPPSLPLRSSPKPSEDGGK